VSTVDLQQELQTLKKTLTTLEHRIGERYQGPLVPDPPVREYTTVVKDSQDPGYVNRLLVATPCTGSVRIEWVMGRYGQVVPCNWSQVQMMQFMSGFNPLRYQVADAQNLIVKAFIQGDFEWLCLVEHDVILPPDAFRTFNRYMREERTPVVSGLYYTRSRPSEPLVYRGRGVSFYSDWEFGDLVWCDGVPTGCLLIHRGILKAMWDEAEIYFIEHPSGRRDEVRRVFDTPRGGWFDQDTGAYNMSAGTSDLDWCTRVMKGGYFEKGGWPEFQELEYPFLVDTRIFARHINPDGEQFP
jgi:hypothetical protein